MNEHLPPLLATERLCPLFFQPIISFRQDDVQNGGIDRRSAETEAQPVDESRSYSRRGEEMNCKADAYHRGEERGEVAQVTEEHHGNRGGAEGKQNPRVTKGTSGVSGRKRPADAVQVQDEGRVV